MKNGVYTTLTRQSGLMREMQVIANNIANMSTKGFRQQGVVFSEFVRETGDAPSLSMAEANTVNTSLLRGDLTETGNALDLGIEGEGFFLIDTDQGLRLTRAGSFSLSDAGEVVTPQGDRVLDVSQAPILLPGGMAGVSIAPDGTISRDGLVVSQVGLFRPVDDTGLKREDGVMFDAPEGIEPEPDGRMRQGFVEGSNVDPILQIARMIEVQRSYEMGQKFLEREDNRVRDAMQSLTR
jgi:flagellar basal-body rod protein FlgF